MNTRRLVQKTFEEDLSPVLNGYFQKKRYDLQIVDYGNNWFCGYVIIHFPKLTISNNNGESKEIHDLYVRMHMTKGTQGYSVGSFEGICMKRTYSEMQYGYMHSHLSPRTGMASWASFCTGGSATPMSGMLNEMYEAELFSMETFELFIAHLVPYLEHESLEGTPHRYIMNCRPTENNDPGNSYISAYKDLKKKVRTNEIIIPIEHYIQGNHSVAIRVDQYDPRWKEIMKQVARCKGVMNEDGVFTRNASSSTEYKQYMRMNKQERRNGLGASFVFKGRPVKEKFLRPAISITERLGDDQDPKEEQYIINKINGILKSYGQENKTQINRHGAAPREIRRMQDQISNEGHREEDRVLENRRRRRRRSASANAEYEGSFIPISSATVNFTSNAISREEFDRVFFDPVTYETTSSSTRDTTSTSSNYTNSDAC